MRLPTHAPHGKKFFPRIIDPIMDRQTLYDVCCDVWQNKHDPLFAQPPNVHQECTHPLARLTWLHLMRQAWDPRVWLNHVASAHKHAKIRLPLELHPDHNPGAPWASPWFDASRALIKLCEDLLNEGSDSARLAQLTLAAESAQAGASAPARRAVAEFKQRQQQDADEKFILMLTGAWVCFC